MPAYDDIHPELCSRWIVQALTANAAIVATHGNRFYQDINVPDGPTFPYIYWTGGEEMVAQWMLRKEYIGKIQSRYVVRSVRRYLGSGGSWADFAGSYKGMRDALTGIGCTEVRLPNNTLLGHVFQSRYIQKYQVSTRDGDIKILEHGIIIEIVHK